MKTSPLLGSLCWLVCAWAPLDAAPGRLVIAGGALAPDNDRVHGAFIAAADAAGPGRAILIVPAASARPTESGEAFRAQLLRRGVAAERVRVLPLAVKDDPTTAGLDESAWAGNGADAALAAEAREAGAFWFVGGDQSRIVGVLRGADGADTPLLAAIREAHGRGAALGGTSAGAAIMSDPMILGGDSLGALRRGVTREYAGMDQQESGALILGRGLGFFAGGIVDQHFDKKARHARLLVGMARTGARRGFGVEENGAMVVDLAAGEVEVAGPGGLVLLDATEAEFAPEGAPFAARGVRVAILSDGDRLSLADLSARPAAGRKPTRGNEYFNVAEPALGAGIVPYGDFRGLATTLLADNRAAESVAALVFGGAGGGEGWRLTLSKDAATSGHVMRGDYTVTGLRLDLEPVTVRVAPR